MTTPLESDACLIALKQGDPDRYWACLFSPAHHRGALAALYAFNLEIARTRELVSEPMIGEIRLQWWREAINGERADEAIAHPIAGSLVAAIARYRLPVQPLIDLIDARIFDLYDDPMGTMVELEAYCGETASALFRLASIILADGGDMGSADLAGHAGVAFGIAGLLTAFPWHAARGQLYLSREVLERHRVKSEDISARHETAELIQALADMRLKAREHLRQAHDLLAGAPLAIRPAYLPLVVVEPRLRAMEKPGYRPFSSPIEPNRIAMLFKFWRASQTGRI